MTQRRARGEGAVFYSEAKACWVWRAVVGRRPDGSVRYKEGRARTQGGALRRKQAAEKGQLQPHGEKETVGEHLAHWLEDVAKPNVRPNTWRRYEQVVRKHILPRIGGHPLRTLAIRHVTRLWADMHKEGVSAGTIKKCSEVFATALESAVAEEKIPSAPTRGASKPQVRRRSVEVFTDEEVRKIIAAAAGDRLEPLILTAIGTGAREGELFALDVADVDLAGGAVVITKMLDEDERGKFHLHPPKSASGVRSVDLPVFARESLRRHLDGRPTGPLFTDADGGYLRKSNFIRRDWKGLLKRAGVRYRKPHTLRHTYASRLLADGMDVAEVARRLGDRVETVNRVYAHWIPIKREGANRLDAIYGPPAG